MNFISFSTKRVKKYDKHLRKRAWNTYSMRYTVVHICIYHWHLFINIKTQWTMVMLMPHAPCPMPHAPHSLSSLISFCIRFLLRPFFHFRFEMRLKCPKNKTCYIYVYPIYVDISSLDYLSRPPPENPPTIATKTFSITKKIDWEMEVLSHFFKHFMPNTVVLWVAYEPLGVVSTTSPLYITPFPKRQPWYISV